MKRTLLLLSLSASSTWAAVSVTDYGHIFATKINQTVNYLEYVQQATEAARQTKNQIEELRRLGDFGDFFHIDGLDTLYKDLSTESLFKDIDQIKGLTDGKQILSATAGGLFKPIGNNFSLGEEEFARKESRYKPAEALQRQVQNYKVVQGEVAIRRTELKESIAKAQVVAQTATTEAEAAKANASVAALQNELATVDQEETAAAVAVEMQKAEIAAQEQAKKEALQEQTERDFRESGKRMETAYKLEIKRAEINWGGE